MANDWSRLSITDAAGECLLRVKVVPGASRSAVVGLLDQSLKLAVAAAPEAGKANDAVILLLASVLGLPARDIRLAEGQTRPQKRLAIRGLTAAEVRARLARHLADAG